ncbi:phytoene synthase [Sphingomonas sp. PP-F2F-A104-K0414]|nr:phytoene synthase [Sphingomonas sp. PP-F2F-A104-K0414]
MRLLCGGLLRYRTRMTRDTATFALALSYAPTAMRPGLAALFALDDRLAAIVRSTREPMVGQMRLTWWYEALGRLDEAAAPQEPMLQAIAQVVQPHGVSGSSLAAMTDGWEMLLQEELTDTAIALFAKDRGGRLFAAAGTILGVHDPRIALAGEGWALVDLALGMTDPRVAARARSLAKVRFRAAFTGRWPRRGRSLGAMALMAQFDATAAADGAIAPTRRIARLLRHRLTGY